MCSQIYNQLAHGWRRCDDLTVVQHRESDLSVLGPSRIEANRKVFALKAEVIHRKVRQSHSERIYGERPGAKAPESKQAREDKIQEHTMVVPDCRREQKGGWGRVSRCTGKENLHWREGWAVDVRCSRMCTLEA